MIGGLSLGAMTGASLAGAVRRRALMDMLARARHFPTRRRTPPGRARHRGRTGGRGRRHLPRRRRPGPPGRTHGRDRRRRCVHPPAGRRGGALETLAGQLPPGLVTVIRDAPWPCTHRCAPVPHLHGRAHRGDGVHRAPAAALLLPGPPTTGHRRGRARPVRPEPHRPHQPAARLRGHARARRPTRRRRRAVDPGRTAALPFPVIHVDQPEHIEKVMSAIYELGVDSPTSGVAA
ncbi:hypothetical protein NKH77_01305 [Streptomyces sp. M19]